MSMAKERVRTRTDWTRHCSVCAEAAKEAEREAMREILRKQNERVVRGFRRASQRRGTDTP